jgi:phosphoesterase RecJ-like protein
MRFQAEFRQISSLIGDNQRFLITSHIHTDGDAIGSSLALYHYLNQLGKAVRVAIPGNIPVKYGFLNTKKIINHTSQKNLAAFIQEAQVVFILDISTLDRLDEFYQPIQESAAYKICIDHHPVEKGWTDLLIQDTTRIATAEIIYDLLRYLKANFNSEIAEALFTAILSDSGGFRYPGTTRDTFRIAADLMGYGPDPARIYNMVYEQASVRQLRVWGRLLHKIEVDGHFSWITIPFEFIRDKQIFPEEVDGLIDLLRKDSKAAVVGVFVQKNEDRVQVGLRSKNGVDVGEIARGFGGGGHKHAAGFTVGKSLIEVVDETKIKVRIASRKVPE